MARKLVDPPLSESDATPSLISSGFSVGSDGPGWALWTGPGGRACTGHWSSLPPTNIHTLLKLNWQESDSHIFKMSRTSISPLKIHYDYQIHIVHDKSTRRHPEARIIYLAQIFGGQVTHNDNGTCSVLTTQPSSCYRRLSVQLMIKTEKKHWAFFTESELNNLVSYHLTYFVSTLWTKNPSCSINVDSWHWHNIPTGLKFIFLFKIY